MASSSQIPRRRNRPAGQPDPTVEVIALSPKTLLEIHADIRKGSNNENRKKVFVCPEPTCKYHHPSRAARDLNSIKKHFSRKHSNIKNWKCDRCSKFYAVEADLKAHLKKCKGNVKRRRRNCEDGGEGYLRPSDGASSSHQPMPPILSPFPNPRSPIISIENSGSSIDTNKFTFPPFANELTFTPLKNLTYSDEVEKVNYNESVFGIMEMQSMRQIPQAPSMNSTMPYSTMNPEFSTMVGTPACEMVKGATIQPEIVELSHDHMLAAVEEAMGLKGISSASYGSPLPCYDDLNFFGQ